MNRLTVRWTIAFLLFASCADAPDAERKPDPRLADIARFEDARDHRAELEAMLAVPEPAVRRSAARALGRLREVASAEALAGVLMDSDETVALEALFAYGHLGTPDERPSSAPLKAALKDERSAVRSGAVESLGRLADSDSLDAIASRLADADAEVRAEAALAIWRAKGHAYLSALATALDRETSVEARWRMAFALAGLRRPKARDGSEPPALDDPAPIIAQVRPRLDDADRRVRAFAVTALGRLMEPEAAAALFAPRLTSETDWIVRVHLVRALGAPEPPPATALAALRGAAVRGGHPLVRATALEAIAKAKDADGAEAIETCLRAKSLTVRRAALAALAVVRGADATASLTAALDDADARTRAAALAGLAEANPAVAVGVFTKRFDDAGLHARSAMMASLKKLAVVHAWTLARRGLAETDLAVRTLAANAIGERAKDLIAAKLDAIPVLVEALAAASGPSDYEARQTVIGALAKFDDPRSIAALRGALEDPVGAVREAAATALTELTKETVTAPEGGPTPTSDGAPDAVAARTEELARTLTIKTSRGILKFELFVEQAPVHSANVIGLTRRGFYDGLEFHRVVPAFVVQGGDPRRDGWGDPGYTIRAEVNRRRYVRGTLGMPDAGLDTGGCQLFVTHLPTPHLDGRYTTFGQLVEGFDVLDRIEVGDRIIEVTVE